MSNKLFVGGLSWNTDDEMLRQAFEPHGTVTQASVVMDRDTDRSRGFGFVTMESAEMAQTAIQAMDSTVLDGRTIRVHLKLSTRVGFIPAGLHFRARMDIDDNLNGRLSELSCTGDEALGPLIGGLIQPFIEKYNGTTRPLMNFPATNIRLRGVEIVAEQTIRVSAAFGS